MSLLREIQKDAVDSNVKLATLLRKCKVLAARLGNLEFKQWVESELNGYNGNSSEELPNYRIIKVNSKGHFSGPFGSGLRNADMPLLCVPEEAREVLGHSYFRDPVAALEALVDQSDSGIAQEPWKCSPPRSHRACLNRQACGNQVARYLHLHLLRQTAV